MTAAAPLTPAAAAPSVRRRLGAFVALTKPRIIELLLVTTVPIMVVAEGGLPSGWLVLFTVVGGTMAAGGANAVNMVVDRDIDALMQRTRNRPLVTGEMTPRAALVFALTLEAAAFGLLWWTVNLLSAALALGAFCFYVFVYTLWLKRTSRQNIVIGGAAGAAPALIGWSAVTGELAWPAVMAFLVVFLWTPPHFWALAVRYRDDYASAEVPMLPSVASDRTVTTQIVGYTVALVAASLAFAPLAGTGWIYLAVAVVTGAAFLAQAIVLAGDPTPRRAMHLFAYSITYLTLLFGAMAADTLLLGPT